MILCTLICIEFILDCARDSGNSHHVLRALYSMIHCVPRLDTYIERCRIVQKHDSNVITDCTWASWRRHKHLPTKSNFIWSDLFNADWHGIHVRALVISDEGMSSDRKGGVRTRVGGRSTCWAILVVTAHFCSAVHA